MDDTLKSVKVHLGRQGRLVLEKQDTIKQRLKARFAHLPEEHSLVDDLIAERREAARAEAAE
ncbi:hypothetical protein [Gloeobacter morelensis]|uniref:Uncharacterized protein n=1 Tax=Gloeobacter morelensis MG652769 TaxID=2781736 RepID=A0ABY3PHR5_9CYAN|nr:hypothetical protein [Gloeobacter morelensis]UFP93208.1 hypothetical protein ISF26_15510 [Gloeobacter morelensis MG652769]